MFKKIPTLYSENGKKQIYPMGKTQGNIFCILLYFYNYKL
jgi:hypothetical protein